MNINLQPVQLVTKQLLKRLSVRTFRWHGKRICVVALASIKCHLRRIKAKLPWLSQ